MFSNQQLQSLLLMLLQGSSFSLSSFSPPKFCQYCKKQGHDKSKCLKLKKKTLIVRSPNVEDKDVPIEVSSEDTIYEDTPLPRKA